MYQFYSQNDYLTLFNKHRRSTITKVRRSFVLELFDIKSRGLKLFKVLCEIKLIQTLLPLFWETNTINACYSYYLTYANIWKKMKFLIFQYHSVTVELGNFVKKALYHFFLFQDVGFKLEETFLTESNHTLSLASWWIG